MTPAIHAARKAKIAYELHAYVHDPASAAYGLEALEKLCLSADRVFKTLVVSVDNQELIVGVVPVSSMLSMKSLAKASQAFSTIYVSAGRRGLQIEVSPQDLKNLTAGIFAEIGQ